MKCPNCESHTQRIIFAPVGRYCRTCKPPAPTVSSLHWWDVAAIVIALIAIYFLTVAAAAFSRIAMIYDRIRLSGSLREWTIDFIGMTLIAIVFYLLNLL